MLRLFFVRLCVVVVLLPIASPVVFCEFEFICVSVVEFVFEFVVLSGIGAAEVGAVGSLG